MGRRRTAILLVSIALAIALAMAVAITLGQVPRMAVLGKPFTLRLGQTATIRGTTLRIQYATCLHLEPESRGDPSAVTELLATLDGDTVVVWVEFEGEPATVGDYSIVPEDVSFFCLGDDAKEIQLVVARLE